MKATLRILHLEDDRRDAELVRETLAANSIVADVERVDCECDFVAQLEQNEFDLILADYSLPSFSGISALTIARAKRPDKPFIFVSGTPGEEAVIETLKGGATDYVRKHCLQKLPLSVRRAMTEVEERTEHGLADEAQAASELRYRRLFESAKDGILIIDADTGKIVDANPYIMETLGYSYEELVGKELWEIGVFKDIAASKKAFDELQDQTYLSYDDLPLETRGGLVIEVEFVSNVYLVGDSKVIQCNIRGITERRLGKRALEATNRKLEATLAELSATTQQLWQASKLATMGELSASIAHELNNPLTTVALRVEDLLILMAKDDKRRGSLQVIAQEVDRMANLVDNLLQFSRRGHRQISTVDVREEIANTVEFVHYHLRTHKIEIVREFADPLPTIQADHQQLRQLFLNLLTNASDAMPQGGTLTARAKISVLHEAEAVQIDFVDTGSGITAENLKKIWDPFFTTKVQGKGTGLGLAICRRIVEEHGGTIEIESETGCGTTVRMLFPVTATEARANLG